MGLLNVGKVGFDTAWNFALGLPKHDLGWPPLRPLFRDTIYKGYHSYSIYIVIEYIICIKIHIQYNIHYEMLPVKEES